MKAGKKAKTVTMPDLVNEYLSLSLSDKRAIIQKYKQRWQLASTALQKVKIIAEILGLE